MVAGAVAPALVGSVAEAAPAAAEKPTVVERATAAGWQGLGWAKQLTVPTVTPAVEKISSSQILDGPRGRWLPDWSWTQVH